MSPVPAAAATSQTYPARSGNGTFDAVDQPGGSDLPGFPIYPDLRADGPHPELGDAHGDFGRFVGRWDVDVEFYDDGGVRVYNNRGEWAFAWVLDGRVIQDVLTYPRVGASSTEAGRGIGTSLRSYDPATGRWQVIWLGAVTGVTVVLHGGPDGHDLRLMGTETDGTLNRWRFTDIDTNRFLWIGHESRDNGATWILRQRMTATRRTP